MSLPCPVPPACLADELVARASCEPAVAEFVATADAAGADAAGELAVTDVAAVPGGWASALWRMRCGDGTLVAVKVPLRGDVDRELAAQTLLADAGLGPEVVSRGERWLAIRWVPGGRLGDLLTPVDLELSSVARLAAALAATPTVPGGRNGYAKRVELAPDRAALLATVGIDSSVVDRLTVLRDELMSSTVWGFCHGDLHPANVLGPQWELVDAHPHHGPRAAELAFLLSAAACGMPSRKVTMAAAAAAAVPVGEIEAWADVFAVEWLTCALAQTDTDRRHAAVVASLSAQVRRFAPFGPTLVL
jgi:streptomycin 6-kinase